MIKNVLIEFVLIVDGKYFPNYCDSNYLLKSKKLMQICYPPTGPSAIFVPRFSSSSRRDEKSR